MNEAAPRVLELLTYIEQVEKLKIKPAFSVPKDFFSAHQRELIGLPELQFNIQSEGDDVWLRVPRLQEIAAPEVGDTLLPWIVLPKTPDKSPELKSENILYAGKREISRERLADHPEIQELFDWYVENQWTPWASAEVPRRKTIALYNRLFSLHQAVAIEGNETPLELAWGIGYATWKKPGFATAVQYPLLTQACEVTLNEKTFDLEIRPRESDPRLEADCYAEMEVSGVRQLEAFWKATVSANTNRVNPFEDSTFDGILKAAVGYLDPAGSYEVRTRDNAGPAMPEEKLRITNSWVIFGRKRSVDIFIEDVRRLKEKVNASAELPGVIRGFVEHGDDTIRPRPEQPFRGLSSSDSQPGAFELYFPMAYNDEQVSIIQKLESNDGVVVQGPPGTGKTHTIANVISHYLAQGKRVLVTAKGESPLAVLQEKLPERIRPLSVALLSDERDGMKQFEHSIEMIASSVASINPQRMASTIAEAEKKLNQLHAKIAHVDSAVSAYAEKHMRNYTFQGRQITPEEMAKLVLENAEEYSWFDDEPPVAIDDKLPFDAADIVVLREARLVVGDDLGYLQSSLPAPEGFPAWSDLFDVHRDLTKARAIEASVAQGHILTFIDSRAETLQKAQALSAFLNDRASLIAKIQKAQQPWSDTLCERLTGMQAEDPLWVALRQICGDVRALETTRRELLTKAVDIPVDAEKSDDFNEAVGRQVAGKSAFALPFFNGDARKLIKAVTVLGVAPASSEDWVLVQRMAAWRVDARKALVRWNAISAEFGLEPADPVVGSAFKNVVQWQACVEDVHRLVTEFNAVLLTHVQEVFGKETADKLENGGESVLSKVLLGLEAQLDKQRLVYAQKYAQELLGKLNHRSGGIVNELRSFLSESLGRGSADEGVLQTTWNALIAELKRLVEKRGAFEDIKRVTAKLEAAGARKWAARLRTKPATADHDEQIPTNWLEAWNWRQAVTFLDGIDGHHKLRGLFEERKTLTTALAKTYQDIVAEKTWLGVFNNSPDSVRQALQAYLTSVQAIGAGTGVRAIRHRKTAREAMQRAYKAVPCWVLPHWRVSETIPAEIGLFDLVIIDEASQSDIWALPSMLRGKKLLVVGDHKQVSPSAVGMAEEKIKELTGRFLNEQPHGAHMTPDRSIYDLAKVVFAGNSVMLKEHFRCVPAIIEFSNREFYEGDIKPLRIPKANERLDPPLVDVYVKGGFRKGDVNVAEAEAIVQEIETILADEQFAGRTIGVVTLLGTNQAAYIQDLIGQRISPSDMLARKIAVGAPPVFQGRERDIMMVSMVLQPGDRAAQTKADMLQRFNVALSRARDRMYLFRSVTEEAFREETLNAKLIRHFRQPFHQDVQQVQELRNKCESGFEVEMYDELVQRGYRVQPQVPCGGFHIDFVVEGREGRRLAIECDGDRFHGPGQWSADMARQRMLERAGWTFWRCFASSFVRRRDEVLADLIATLERLGIEPLGAESVDNTVWVHYKEVDPLGVDSQPEPEQQDGDSAEASGQDIEQAPIVRDDFVHQEVVKQEVTQ